MGDSGMAYSGPGPHVIILLGSKSDMEHRGAIARGLDRFGVSHETRIASAHKVTRYLLNLLDAYEHDGQPYAYVTVAGRSNALSGVVDANSLHPVIACPPRTVNGSAAWTSSLPCACPVAWPRCSCWSSRARLSPPRKSWQ